MKLNEYLINNKGLEVIKLSYRRKYYLCTILEASQIFGTKTVKIIRENYENQNIPFLTLA